MNFQYLLLEVIVSLDQGYEFTSSSLQHLSRDGFRYFDSGNVTVARYAAILSQGVSTGLQAEYQQAQGGSISDVQDTGDVDQVIQIYGDSTHGNFDYTNYLVFKVQGNGFRQAEADIVSVFERWKSSFYVTSLNNSIIPNFTIGKSKCYGINYYRRQRKSCVLGCRGWNGKRLQLDNYRCK